MAESSSASERSRSPSPARAVTGPKSSRTFVWLRELPKAIPRGKPWDQLNRDGRVKEIEFGKKFTERQMRDLVRQNFTELEQADFKRIRLYKSGSRGSVLKRVAKNVPDASTLLHKFSGGSSKRVYILFKSDDENEGGPNSRTEPSTTPTVTDNTDVPPTLPLPRGGFSTRQYITSLAESSRTQETDNDFTLSPRTDTFQGVWTPASPRSTGHSNINPVIQLTIEDDADLLQSPFDNSVIALDPIQDEIEEETTKLKSSKGVFGTPFYGEGTKVGTVAGDMSPNGLGEESSLPSRTNEVVRCEKRLLASCRGENTSLPSFLVHSFEELCWQAREMNTPMGIILLNPEKENMAIREGIVRALRWLTSQNQQWLFWIAETSSVNGRSVCSMFSVRNTTDSMLFLLPSTTWKPTLVKQLHDNNLTDIDVQDRLSEVMDKTCDALKVLSAQREKLNTLRKDRAEQEEDLRRAQQKESQERKEREEKEKEKEEKDKKKEEDNDNKEKDVRSARNARVNAEPVLGSTIRVKSQNGTRQRKFETGAHFQEVYDWAGAIESFPLYFTLHRGGVLVSHAETIEQDETLNVTEREEAEMEHFFRNEVSFKGNFNFRESLSETLKDEDIEKEGESDEEMEKEKNVGEKRKRKRKSKDDKRTTAKRLKKKKEKNL